MPGRLIPPTIRASVIAELKAGTALDATAAIFGIGLGSVHRIKRQWEAEHGEILPAGQPFAEQVGNRMEPPRAAVVEVRTSAPTIDLGERVARYLDANLEALEAQARLFADGEWLRAQHAGELADLHVKLNDRAVRILASLFRAPAEPGPDDPDGDGAGPE